PGPRRPTSDVGGPSPGASEAAVDVGGKSPAQASRVTFHCASPPCGRGASRFQPHNQGDASSTSTPARTGTAYGSGSSMLRQEWPTALAFSAPNSRRWARLIATAALLRNSAS